MKFVLQREVLLDFVLQVHALQSRGSSKSVTKYCIESHKIIQYTLGNKTKIEYFSTEKMALPKGDDYTI